MKNILLFLTAIAFSCCILQASENPAATVETNTFVRKFVTSGIDCYHLATKVNGIYNAKYYKILLSNVETGDQISITSNNGDQFVNHSGLTVANGLATFYWTPQDGESGVCTVTVYKNGLVPYDIGNLRLVTESKVSGKIPNAQGYTGATEDYAIYYMDNTFQSSAAAKSYADSIKAVFIEQWQKQITTLRLAGGTVLAPVKPADSDNLYEIFITDGTGQSHFYTDSLAGYRSYAMDGPERRIFIESNLGVAMPEYGNEENAMRSLLAREFYRGVLNTINPQLMQSTASDFKFITSGISFTIASILYPNIEMNYSGNGRSYYQYANNGLANIASMAFGMADELNYARYAIFWRYIFEHSQQTSATEYDKCKIFKAIVAAANPTLGLAESRASIDEAFVTNGTAFTSLNGCINSFGSSIVSIQQSQANTLHWGDWLDPQSRYTSPSFLVTDYVDTEKSYSLNLQHGSCIAIADFPTDNYFARTKRISIACDTAQGLPFGNIMLYGSQSRTTIPLQFKRNGGQFRADVLIDNQLLLGNEIKDIRLSASNLTTASPVTYLVEIKQVSSQATTVYSPFEVPKISLNSYMKSIMAVSNPSSSNITFECDVRDLNTYPTVKLFYRKHKDASYTPITMNKKNPGLEPNANHTETYTCTIPAIGALSHGVDFYFYAENSERRSTLPETLPDTHPYYLFVSPSNPPEISIKSITNLNDNTIGHPVEIIIRSVSSPNQLEEIRANFKITGDEDYTFSTFLPFGAANEYRAIIPSAYASTAGIDYYISAMDKDSIIGTLGHADAPLKLVYKNLRITSHQALQDSIYFGSPNRISWTSVNMRFVNVYYMTDNAPWQLIEREIPSAQGYYDWNLGFVGHHRVWIKIIDSEDSLTYSSTGPCYVKYLTNSVELTSPNGGENWLVGEKHDIEWTSKDVANVRLDWSTDGGASWHLITNSTPAAYGKYMNWSIPRTPSANVLIRISDADHLPINDISDDCFQITGVKLKNPNGGEKLFMGLNYIVNWDAVGINYLTLQYSSDRGANWNDLTISQDPLSSFYSWTVPMNPSNDYLFRTTDSDRSLLSDTSDQTFSVVGLLLKKPMGGERFLAGTYQEIEWQATQMQYVKLEYSTDNGSHWTTIISQIPAVQSNYVWQVPKDISPDCKVRVSNVADPAIFDQNTSNFSIDGVGIVVNYPNGGETLIANSTYTVSWFSVGVNSVRLDYSTDNGRNWINIVQDVPATQSVYQWTTPSNPSVECLVRVADNNLPHIVDFSDEFFTIQGGLYPVPSDWNVFLTSDKTATIILPTTANPQVGGRNMATGDAVGVFYRMPSNHWVCGGFSVYESGKNMAIAVFGDNPETAAKDGFADGEEYYLLVWDAQAGRAYEANVTYSQSYSTTPELFGNDKLSPITSLTTYSEFTVDVPRYVWNIISSNVIPNDNSIANIAAPVIGSIKRIKDQNGASFPAPGTLTNWNYLEGYQIYTTDDITLRFYGLRANLSASPIYLPGSMKWSLIPFLPELAQSTSSAISSINTNMLLLKNYQGRVYFPLFSINQVSQLRPGEGYKVCMINPDTLIYTNLLTATGGAAPKRSLQFSQKYTDFVENTGNSANLLIRCDSATNGTSAGVFTRNGLLIGSGQFDGGKAGVTVWGDNPNTPQIEGALESEELVLKLWENNTNQERLLNIIQITDLLQPQNSGTTLNYSSDAALIIRSVKGNFTQADDTKNSGLLISCSPNPSNGSIIVKWGMQMESNIEIDIIDAKGETVSTIFTGLSSAGEHSQTYDCAECESGVYFVRIRTANGQVAKKISIIK